MRESGRDRGIRKPPQAAKLRRRPVDETGLGAAWLRSCLGRFATGVTVVTFDTPEGPGGVTVNSFTSVSLEPPVVLVSIARTTKAHDKRLEGALAHVECAPWRTYDGGDHSLFLGEIVDFAHRDGDALGYMGSRFTTIAEPGTGVEYLI